MFIRIVRYCLAVDPLFVRRCWREFPMIGEMISKVPQTPISAEQQICLTQTLTQKVTAAYGRV